MYATLEKLEAELEATLKALKLKYKKRKLVNNYSVQFMLEEFGVVVCGLHAADYSNINNILLHTFGEWRLVYIALTDSFLDKKEELIWDLMRSGYIRNLRNNYPREFKAILQERDFGRQIITKRLKVWANKPKYKYLIEENKNALNYNISRLLILDPAFFDYMPEEDCNA